MFSVSYFKIFAPSALQITELADQISIKLISHLIKIISVVPQKLLKYFKSTAISTFFVPALLIRLFLL